MTTPTNVYLNKLIDDVKHVKMGSPLKVDMSSSKVDMYRRMKPTTAVDLNLVFEKDNKLAGEEPEA